MKKLLVIFLALAILAFIFANGLFYLAGRWQERTGEIKKAVRTYTRLIEKHPRSRWAAKAKEAIKRLEKLGKKRKKGEMSVKEPVAPYIGALKKTEKKLKDIEEKKEKEYKEFLEEIGE